MEIAVNNNGKKFATVRRLFNEVSMQFLSNKCLECKFRV